jgi:hypothetical protein
MNLFHDVLDVPSAGFAMQKNLELADPQVYPLTLEKTVTTTDQLAAVPAANLLLGTTLVLAIDGVPRVFRLAAGTDASNPPRVIRPVDYAETNQRVWKWIPIYALAPCADNGMIYPILVRISNGFAQTYLGSPF